MTTMRLSRRHVMSALAASLATPYLVRPARAAAPLRVGVPIWVGWMPFWVLDKKGLTAKHGLDLNLIEFPVQTDARQALASGNLDVCALNTADVVVVDAEAPLAKVIALTNASNGADIVIARGVSTLADLKGKTVALEIGSVSHFFFASLLAKAGLSEKDVTITNMSAQDAGTAFAAGAIDVSVTWEPFASQGIAAGGTALATSVDTPDLIIDLISARSDVLETRADEVKRLLDAWFEALDFVGTNKDEAFAIMADHSGVSVAEFEGMWSGVKMYSRADNIALMGAAGAPGAYVGAVDATSAFMLANDLVPSVVPAAEIIDPALLA
ncbi:NitT/TauT family transport system substrate-binding protein [Rhodobacter sp. 140A]|jgi:ABC-type nitrate/sulfonate/bicarbonate transport systems, periplasmic components|uniref:ABC transporter substrate-binding protein n=1 Tax=Thioclava TaxID=285107 RepID=UPI000C54E648|nr:MULTISPECIES: ABC transporter substrate-binding protein [Thioclava]MAQ38450.1 hypothetical protein [Thioclava sp.]MAQ38462.1 hypothetical protein [Thioclava sp.]RBP84956.1 NitT/TauT family transport system substrate-binding protein [Rhodobacter sp. 140A]|tara:strand:- start:76 stop:1053 length:978 start_codon:yes stop_codon:yes gene_type:complete